MAKRTRWSFTPQFKSQVVLAVLTGAQSQAKLCRHHGLKPELVALWKKTFLDRMPSVFEGQDRGEPEAARVAELERLIGRLVSHPARSAACHVGFALLQRWPLSSPSVGHAFKAFPEVTPFRR